MGFFSAVGTALGLVNSNPTASELAKDISSGVDMMFYTDEEKAIDKAAMTAEAMTAWLRMVEAMKDSEKYRSITRRILAVGIVFNLLTMIWICIFSEVAAVYQWFGAAELISLDGMSFTPVTWSILKLATVFNLGWVFCTIIVFYFGPALIQHLKKK